MKKLESFYGHTCKVCGNYQRINLAQKWFMCEKCGDIQDIKPWE